MYSELTGSVPRLPTPFAKTLINRAYADTCRKNLWSFNLFEANWVSPALVTAGSVTVTQGSNAVVFDSDASAAITSLALLATFPTPLLQRQFRVGISTIYNIWAYAADDDTGIVTLTLDRPYTDTSGSTDYSILQCYYPAPMKDFKSWIRVRDITNFNDLDTESEREVVDLLDPQRSIYYLPTKCVPYQLAQNPSSDIYRFPLFELWGVPQYQIVYQLYGIRKGSPLAQDSDELPPAIGEDCVLALARVYSYEWMESNKGDAPRSQGSDYRFLMGAAKAEYDRLWKDYRKDDREFVNAWFTTRRLRNGPLGNSQGFYNAIGNTANPGAAW